MNKIYSDRRSAVRIKYDVSYRVANCDGGQVPRRGDFRQVRGCDLSPIGLSFYSDAPPKTDHLALMFKGQQDEAYMLARVIHQKPCLMDGQRRYLIGCEFLRALLPEECA